MAKNYIVSDYYSEFVKNNLENCHFHSFAAMQSNGIKDCLKFFDQKNWETRNTIIDNWDYTFQKQKRLSKIISERLSLHFKYNYSNKFWNYLFSLNLLKYITILYNFFSIVEKEFRTNKFLINELNLKKVDPCCNFESTTNFLNINKIGKEFLLTIYYLNFIKKENYPPEFEENTVGSQAISISKTFKTFKKFISQKSVSYDKLKVGIIGSFFDHKTLNQLKEKSGFKISDLSLPPSNKSSSRSTLLRSKIFDDFDEMDRFDKFFLSCSKFIFPTDLIEDLDFNLSKHENFLNKLRNLEYIVTEAWLGSTEINIFRSIAFEKKSVKTLYNEHNCFFHPYLGGLVEFQSNLVDQYLTMGWNNKNPKFITTSSLFPFTFNRKTKSKIKYLYVSYPIIESKTFYTSLYSNSDYSGYVHLLFVQKFFSLLEDHFLNQISYRGYPKDYNVKLSILGKEYFLKNYLDKMNILPSLKFSGPSCREQIASSELVIIDRPSTAYLESLHMNIPTICFFDPTTMFLSEEHNDFFDDLIDAKIVHTTPDSASRHLIEVFESPQDWWQSKKVQDLKNKWLKRNFGKPDVLVNYLLNLAQQ